MLELSEAGQVIPQHTLNDRRRARIDSRNVQPQLNHLQCFSEGENHTPTQKHTKSHTEHHIFTTTLVEHA